MPTVADSFSGLAAAGNLSTRSPWVQRSGVLQGGTGGGNVSPNNASADSIYAYNSGSLASNHSSECAVTLSGGGVASLGPAIRISATGDGYAWIVNEAGTGFLNRYAAGVFVVTLFTSGVGAIASGSVLRISANDSTIKVFDDGVELASVTDATYSGGSPGLAGFSASTLLLATAWSATDGVVAAMRRSSRRRRRSARGNDRSMAAWSDVRFSALGWFDRDLWRVASGPAGFGITGALSDAQDAAASTLATAVGASAAVADAIDAASSALSAAVSLSSALVDQQDAATASLSIQSGFGLAFTLSDQSDGITAALSAAVGLSEAAQDDRDRATAILAATAGLSAALTDEQDRATSSLSATASLSAALLDDQDRISSTVVIGAAPLTVDAAILDAQDGAASAFSALAGLSAVLADRPDPVTAAFSVAVSLAESAADEADRVIANLVAGMSLNAGLTDDSDRLTSDLSIAPIGGIALTSNLLDKADAVIASLSISDVTAPPDGTDGGSGGSASWGSTGGGLLHKFKLAQAFRDKVEREEAVRKLPRATQTERVVLRRAAVKLLRHQPANYKELENRVTVDLNAAGLQAAPHHLDWLLLYLRTEGHIQELRKQSREEEELVLALLMAVCEC